METNLFPAGSVETKQIRRISSDSSLCHSQSVKLISAKGPVDMMKSTVLVNVCPWPFSLDLLGIVFFSMSWTLALEGGMIAGVCDN